MLGWEYWLAAAGFWLAGFGCGVLWFATYAIRHGHTERDPWKRGRS